MEEKRRPGRPRKENLVPKSYIKLRIDDVIKRRLDLEASVKGTSAVALAEELLTNSINKLWPECEKDAKKIFESVFDKKL